MHTYTYYTHTLYTTHARAHKHTQTHTHKHTQTHTHTHKHTHKHTHTHLWFNHLRLDSFPSVGLQHAVPYMQDNLRPEDGMLSRWTNGCTEDVTVPAWTS